jgi:hypothetical protein
VAVAKPKQTESEMFKVIGGVVVYGFALYGLATFVEKRSRGLPNSELA